MKLISFAVPSYNSENYLSKCIDSLLVGGEDVEIIIVNDGSKDRTQEIAEEYQRKYPSIVRAINKENGGHGSGVNKGIELATGLYYKVVDSDDWVDKDALLELLDTIKEHLKNDTLPDAYFTNFVYEHVCDGTSYVSGYKKYIPTNRFFSWEDTKQLKAWHLFLMHAVLYRLDVVRNSGVKLPEHTFYVDNLYAYQPLAHLKKMYYLPVDLYRYFIGRSDQSVTIDNIVKRYDQQMRVMKCMLDCYSYDEIMKMEKHLRKQLLHVIVSIMSNTIFFTTAKDTKERREAYKNFMYEFKTNDIKMYRYIKNRTYLTILFHTPWKLRGAIATASYKFLCKHVKLG
ncbi:MAG: glycosyltransferase [Bacillales bacterium]|nr:glycosyltransferase [Bacillales bacterium]